MTEPLFAPDARQCNKCHEVKPLDEFYKASRGKYGRTSQCKACKADYHAATYVRKGRNHKRREAYTGDEPKTCRTCRAEKPLREFSLSRSATETQNAVYKSECKTCSTEKALKWFYDNHERALTNKRRFNLAKAYGLSLEDYEAMLKRQGGVCAICGMPPAGRNSRDKVLVVDHCHETGVNRGLLCHRCNRAMGLFGDDCTVMELAIAYLRRFQEVV